MSFRMMNLNLRMMRLPAALLSAVLQVRQRLQQVLLRENLPTACEEAADAVARAAMHDKKADGGYINAVFVNSVGSFEIKKLRSDELLQIMKDKK